MAFLMRDVLADIKTKQNEFNASRDIKVLQNCKLQLEEIMNDIPEDPEVLFQYGTALLQLGHFGSALNIFKRVLAYWPSNSHVWSNLGCAERAMHRIPQARYSFKKALDYEHHGDTYSNLASTYINEGEPTKGIPWAEKACRMRPNEPKPAWNLSLLLLESEQWADGFALYENGVAAGERAFRYYTEDRENDLRLWKGEKDVKLVLFDEQGIGDRLLAANALRSLKDAGLSRIVLECHPRLIDIYKRSFPWIDQIYPTVKKEQIKWPKHEKINRENWYKLSTMSLPMHYWKTAQDMDRTPYLTPNPELVAHYREQYQKWGEGPYISISWAGGARKTNNQYRSIKLGWLKPLIEKGGTWISMQYHEWAKEKVENFRKDTNLPLFHLDDAQDFKYDKTLAAVTACDLNITVSNSLVHTCGGGGASCWVMVPKRKAWRYPDGDTFPWYGDHIRQFHQEKDGDWDGVILQLQDHLERWLSEYNPKQKTA